MKKLFKEIGKKGCCLLSSTALAFTMTVASATPAMAANAMDVTSYVSCSPTPMTAAIPEFVGLSLVDERWTIDKASDGSLGMLYNNINNTSGALKYLLMGTSEFNSDPDPYMYNTVYNTTGVQTLQDSKRSAYTSTNMNRALGAYGANTADNAIWDMKPDVIVGVATTANDVTTDYSSEVAAMQSSHPDKFSGYSPIGVANTGTQIELMYSLADAADQIVANSGGTKKIRYGTSAKALAVNYESIIKGSQGYLLSQMEKKNIKKRTIALITANSGGKVTLSNAAFSGLTECLTNVATNYAAKIAGGEASVTIPISQLESAAKDIDLIIVQTDDNTKSTYVPTTGLEKLYSKLYWATDSDCGTIGSDKKGPDVACNYGRIYGCLYPEIFDQSDWVAYYYDTVYHVKANKIGDAVNRAMDGVRNWDVKSGNGNDYLQWTAATVADYNQKEVKSLINEGLLYLKSKGSSLDSSLAMTEDLAKSVESVSSLSNASVTVAASQKYSGSSLTPAPKVVLGSKTLTKGTDYLVSYSNNTNAGTASVKVFGVGAYCGMAEKTFTITQANLSSMTLGKTALTYNGKAQKPNVSVKFGNKVLAANKDYTVTYASGRKNVGAYKVTVKGTGNFTGTLSKTFTINPKATSIKKLTAKSTSFTVQVAKISSQASGYQVRYATSKSALSKAKAQNISTKSSAVSKTISKLKANKTYYVQVRTCMKAGGKTYTSGWSATKTVKTKKASKAKKSTSSLMVAYSAAI